MNFRATKIAAKLSTMHEIGIAASILERVTLVVQQHKTSQVTKVGIRLGPLSGVDPDALRFTFEVLSKDTPMEGARLEIETSHRDELDLSFVELEELQCV